MATPDLLLAGMLAGLLPVVMASPNVLLGFLLLFDLAFFSVLTDLSALCCEQGLPSSLVAS